LKRLNGKISVLLCDREFFSFEFVNYLIETNTPFVIRIKQNLKFIKALKEDLRCVALTHRNVMIGKFKDKELHLDLSGKKLGSEYLLTVSYKVHNPLKEYRKLGMRAPLILKFVKKTYLNQRLVPFVT